MKKLIVFFVIYAVMATAVLAGSVSRSMPSRIEPSSTLTVTLSVSGATAGKLFTLEDVLPVGLTVKEWSITGSQEAKEAVAIRQKDNRFGWSFTPVSDSASVEYKIDLPGSETTYTFGKVVWFDPSGQGSESGTAALSVAAIRCGDSICEGNENSDNCEQDCPRPAPPAEQPAAVSEAMEKKSLSTTTIALIVILGIAAVAAIGYSMMKKKKTE